MYRNEYYIKGKISTGVFPQKFSNQIFFSDHVTGLNIEYQTVYSIKYQISGTEIYEIDGKQFVLTPGKYLVVNDNQKVVCDSASSEKAISIFIDPLTMKDVFVNSKALHEYLLDNSLSDDELYFYQNIFSLENNLLVDKLISLNKLFNIKNFNSSSFEKDFFYDIAGALILSQQQTLKQIKHIDCIKSSTRKELFNRLMLAKDFIIENWNILLTLEDIASEVFMSPYHFHRVFSSAFGTSPSRFYLDVKMKKIKEMILSQRYCVSEVAELSGYSDIFSFSKAFKKYYGVSPSRFYRQS